MTLSLRYPVRSGKERAFEQVFRAVIRALVLDPGHLRSRLLRAKEGQLYELVTEWQDDQSARSFSQSELFMKLAQWSDQNVLEGRPSHRLSTRGPTGTPAPSEETPSELSGDRRIVADSRLCP